MRQAMCFVCLRLSVAPVRVQSAASTFLCAAAESAAADLSSQHEAAGSSHHPDTDNSLRRWDICMEDLPAAAMHSVGSCMHQFCKSCLERHIQTQLQGRSLPVVCPAVQCHSGIDADECSVLLHNKADIALLTQVIQIGLLCPICSSYINQSCAAMLGSSRKMLTSTCFDI